MATGRTTQDGELFNEGLIQSYVGAPRFIARPWLAERVEAALNKDDCRFVLLTAEPGAGKTAFMAWLADRHPNWPRYFIRRDQRTPLQDADDHSFLLRIGYQLAATRPELFSREQVRLVVEQRLGSVAEGGEAVGAEVSRLLASPFHQKVIHIQQHAERTAGAVTGLKVGELVIESRSLSTEDLQNMALFDPAKALQATEPEARIVILVDALDEIRYHGVEGSLLKWLTGCPQLPDNVRFVLTSRPPDGPTKLLCEKQAPFLQQLSIEAGDEPVQRELEVYARSLAKEPDVASILEGTEAGVDGFVEEAVAKAEGNIGYLDALARGVDQARISNNQKGLQKLLTLQELPRHIEGLYAFFIRQIKESVGEQEIRVRDSETGKSHFPLIWDEVCWPVLGVLCVAREPLSVEQVRRLGAIEVEERHVTAALDRLGQFLDRPDGRCRLYHATLPEFLTAETTRQDPDTQDLAIPPATWHRRIADYYWEEDHPGWGKLQDDVNGAYGLNNLAPHLSKGHDGRLRSLISQAWMAARFKGSNYTYDGFITDVMVAWQAAHEETLAQSDADRLPTALADCVRYALIRTSINSLSANYESALVVRAVKTGLWSAERALSVASQVPDAKARAGLFSALLGTGQLEPEQSRQAQQSGVDAALAIEDEEARARELAGLAPRLVNEARTRAIKAETEAALAITNHYSRAKALAAVAPQLTGEAQIKALKGGLASARTIEDEDDRVEALAAVAAELIGETLQEELMAALSIKDDANRAEELAALAPQLRGELLARGLEAALTIEEEMYRADALAALAPRLSAEALVQVLHAALAIRDERWRVHVLAALTPQLTREARSQAVEAGLAAALAIEEWPRAWVLARLAPQLTGEALARALYAALAIENENARALALEALAPHLADEELARALYAALAIEDEDWKARVLVALAPQLTGKALEQALDAALAIEDEPARVRALAALAPQLTGELLARGLEATLAIGNGWKRAEALAALAPQLTGEALARALDAGLAIGEYSRADALAGLAPQLTGEALARGLEAALAIKYEPHRVRALVALAPQLGGEALARALDAALAIGDEQARAWALRVLAPQLTDEALARALDSTLSVESETARAWVLTALAPQLTGKALVRALDAALAIGDEWHQALALASLAPQLTGEALERGLEAALDIDDEYWRARVLASLALQLTGGALEQGLKAALAIKDEWARAEALVGLAPQLTGKTPARGLEAALAIEDEGARVKALAAVAPQLRGEARTQALARGLEAALAIGDGQWRAEALAALAPQLTGELLARGLEAALDFEGEYYRAEVLAALAPQLTGETLARALSAALATGYEPSRAGALAALASQLTGEPLAQGLEAALTTEDEGARAEALTALAPQLMGEAQTQALARALASVLAIEDEPHRGEVLAALAPQLSSELLQRGLEAALDFEDEGNRARALTAFRSVARDPVAVLRSVREAIAHHLLKNLSTAEREDVLRFCAEEKLFAPPLLDQATLAAIAGHIVEVCQEWRWM